MSRQPRRKPASKPAATYTLKVGDLEVTVHRKAIKNLYLRVVSDGARIEVKAPEHVSDAFIEQVVHGRMDWIRAKLLAQAQLHPPLRYETGDEVWILGRAYRLRVDLHPGLKCAIDIRGSEISLCIDPASNTSQVREAAVYAFYREQLEAVMQPYVQTWQQQTGLVANEWRLKRMKTRWGTCNPRARRIWLSVELARVSPACIEYVILHEIAHLHEPSHNHRFREFMSRYMPDWRDRRQQLNRHGGIDCASESDFHE